MYDYEYGNGEELLNEKNPVPAPPVDFVPPFESDPLEGVDLGQWGTRPCDRKVDLYALQPERLNTSGQNNPLKGKLTNCHVTGCERCSNTALSSFFFNIIQKLVADLSVSRKSLTAISFC